MGKVGRPIELTPERQDRIIKALARGNTRTNAARVGGVSLRCFMYWLERGRDGEAPFVQLLQCVKEAEAAAEDMAVSALMRAAADPFKPNAQAAIAWLERRRRRAWRRPTEYKELEVDMTGVSDEKLWEAVQALQKEKKTG